MTTQTIDPMQAAMTATKEPLERTYFGEVVTVDCWFVVLERGTGKRPFDPTRDDPGMRRTAIKIEIQPLKGEFLITQECVHFAAEWLNHTLPSLQKLGIQLADLKGRYVQAKRVPTGATYTNKQNEIKDKTGLVFERLFADGADCVQAADAFFASRGQPGGSGGGAGKVVETDLPADLGLPPEQAFALKSLPALWKASGNDAEKFKALIDSNPMISKYYPSTHPQVQALIGGTIENADDEVEDLPF